MPVWQTLGVRHLVVAVNKMDECEWGKARAHTVLS
jgi:translation elongation factor EF-1alpha